MEIEAVMIISASRRTDIPAFFGEWFMNRIREKEVLVRNPFNPHRITKIPLNRDDIDCIVFWTKNPDQFIKHLAVLDGMGYRYYFQFTLNGYDVPIEPFAGKEKIVETFINLSGQIGKEKIIWRYDPVIINGMFPIEYHVEKFSLLCGLLHPYTEKCVFSFIDRYTFLNGRFKDYQIVEPDEPQMFDMARRMADIAGMYNLPLYSCGEKINLEKLGIGHNKCIDDELIERLFNIKTGAKKDPSQRPSCGCRGSRDIGSYNTCRHDCIYCYARRGPRLERYCVNSPLLCDTLGEEEKSSLV
jgi:hypothetical protein